MGKPGAWEEVKRSWSGGKGPIPLTPEFGVPTPGGETWLESKYRLRKESRAGVEAWEVSDWRKAKGMNGFPS